MEIILKKDVEKLGYADGTRCLCSRPDMRSTISCPQGGAVIASDSNRRALAEVIKQKEKKELKLVAQDQMRSRPAWRQPSSPSVPRSVLWQVSSGSVPPAYHVAEAIKKAVDIEGRPPQDTHRRR
jgi:hypothetical protein